MGLDEAADGIERRHVSARGDEVRPLGCNVTAWRAYRLVSDCRVGAGIGLGSLDYLAVERVLAAYGIAMTARVHDGLRICVDEQLRTEAERREAETRRPPRAPLVAPGVVSRFGRRSRRRPGGR
jgi:hypothetical protein